MVSALKPVRQVSTFLALAVVSAVIGNFGVVYLDERGLYQHPDAKVNAFVAWLSSLVGNQWFHWVGGIIIGFAVGAWLHTTLNRGARGSVPQAKMADAARVVLTFNNNIDYAIPEISDEVSYFYWYHIPSVAVDYSSRQTTAQIGYIMLFVAFKIPVHTNYQKIGVVGGGLLCETAHISSTGAVIRVHGDVRGRTLEAKFSKLPIPID